MKNSKMEQRKDILSIIECIGLTVLFAIIMLVGLGCVIYAMVMQYILQIKKYGAVSTVVSFIPHKSAWFNLGLIPCIISFFFFLIYFFEAKRLYKVYKARKKNGWYDESTEDESNDG